MYPNKEVYRTVPSSSVRVHCLSTRPSLTLALTFTLELGLSLALVRTLLFITSVKCFLVNAKGGVLTNDVPEAFFGDKKIF